MEDLKDRLLPELVDTVHDYSLSKSKYGQKILEKRLRKYKDDDEFPKNIMNIVYDYAVSPLNEYTEQDFYHLTPALAEGLLQELSRFSRIKRKDLELSDLYEYIVNRFEWGLRNGIMPLIREGFEQGISEDELPLLIPDQSKNPEIINLMLNTPFYRDSPSRLKKFLFSAVRNHRNDLVRVIRRSSGRLPSFYNWLDLLFVASEVQNIEIVNSILHVHSPERKKILLAAAQLGDLYIVKRIMEDGHVDVDAVLRNPTVTDPEVIKYLESVR